MLATIYDAMFPKRNTERKETFTDFIRTIDNVQTSPTSPKTLLHMFEQPLTTKTIVCKEHTKITIWTFLTTPYRQSS